jgi:hypothetical protein
MPTTTPADLTAPALAGLAAATAALAIRVSEPFDHGVWLIAYLFLVGFLAQLLLGLGQAGLRSVRGLAAPPRRVRLAQALLWNLGVIAVPVGVLADTRLSVIAGSLSLLAGLTLLGRTALPTPAEAPAGRSRPALAYAGLLTFMAASTFIGTALAWDIPWT